MEHVDSQGRGIDVSSGRKMIYKKKRVSPRRMDSRSTCQHVASRLDSVSDSKAQASLYLKRHEGI